MMDTYADVLDSTNGKHGRKKSDVAVMGVPFDLGATNRLGQREGPERIRDLSALYCGGSLLHDGMDPLEHLEVVDVGDVEIPPANSEKGWQNIRLKASEVLMNTKHILTMGGDQTVTARVIEGIVQASLGEPLTVIHFDARGDYLHPEQGSEMDHTTWVRWCIDRGLVNRFVQVGLRGWGYDKQDMTWAKKNDVAFYPATERDIRARLEEEIVDSSDPIYLSIDLSVLDPAFAPAVAYPEPGGITIRELLSWTMQVVTSGQCVGSDVTELIPSLDTTGITSQAAQRCVQQILTGLATVK